MANLFLFSIFIIECFLHPPLGPNKVKTGRVNTNASLTDRHYQAKFSFANHHSNQRHLRNKGKNKHVFNASHFYLTIEFINSQKAHKQWAKSFVLQKREVYLTQRSSNGL